MRKRSLPQLGPPQVDGQPAIVSILPDPPSEGETPEELYGIMLQLIDQPCCGAEKDDRFDNEAQAAGNLSVLRETRGETDEVVADAGGGLQLVRLPGYGSSLSQLS